MKVIAYQLSMRLILQDRRYQYLRLPLQNSPRSIFELY